MLGLRVGFSLVATNEGHSLVVVLGFPRCSGFCCGVWALGRAGFIILCFLSDSWTVFCHSFCSEGHLCVCVCAQSSLSLSDPMDCVAHQAPLSVGFPRQEWCKLPFPSLEDLPDPRIEHVSPASSALTGGFFTTELLGKPLCKRMMILKCLSAWNVCWGVRLTMLLS